MKHDVIVVGAGPAGSAAAAWLATLGIDVILVDKDTFPRVKPCGDIVTSGAIEEIRKMGALDAVHAAGFFPILGAIYYSPSGLPVITPFSRAGSPTDFVAPRPEFDKILRDYAISVGAKHMRLHVRDLIWENDQVAGVIGYDDSKEQRIAGRVVIAADGSHSLLFRKIYKHAYPADHRYVGVRGYVKTEIEQDNNIKIIYIKDILPGYVWVFSVGSNYVNVGIGTTPAVAKRMHVSLNNVLEELIKSPLMVDMLGNSTKIVEKVGWPLNLGGSAARRTYKGVIFIGDAGGFINPITGEGIGTGIETGRIAAHIIQKALKNGNDSLRLNRGLGKFDIESRKLIKKLINANRLRNMLFANKLPLDVIFKISRITPRLNVINKIMSKFG
ncbi:MAG: geranylgeranyl reductase family protein [Chloroflexi bacterium]|nr:geranylgeranyl reductase family protein [Chloroflexota bacterium]